MFIKSLYQLKQSTHRTPKNFAFCQSNQLYYRFFCSLSRGQNDLRENIYQPRKWEYKMDTRGSTFKTSYSPKIEFQQLASIGKADIMELMNHPLVRRQMPLAKDTFDDTAYQAFITAKKELWLQHQYGPWAFIIDGKFAGWGGLQFEQGDADFALVLHPNYWGMGKRIYHQVTEYAFAKMGLSSITVLLPLSRNCRKVLFRFGFQPDGESRIDGELFLRFRLLANHNQKS